MLKCKFHILHTAPEYSMLIQAHIPVALAALHNFNWKYEQSEPDHDNEDDLIGRGVNGNGNGDKAKQNDGIGKPNEMQDQIAVVMWTQYLEEHVHHGIPLHVQSWRWSNNIFETSKS